MSKPLMPKGTAIWLIENTALTFKQISDFCGLHILEIESLANEENFKSLKGLNPVLSGEVDIDEIKRCEADTKLSLSYNVSKEYDKYAKSLKTDSKKESRFKRKNKPEAILWLITNYNKINDYQIAKLLNTTANTVKSIRSKTYWNYKNLSPKNPVTIELCTEDALSKIIQNIKEKEELAQA
jgi:hypothetical protein